MLKVHCKNFIQSLSIGLDIYLVDMNDSLAFGVVSCKPRHNQSVPLSKLATKYINHIHKETLCPSHWLNCIYLTNRINFRISHIFRKGNTFADKLANFGLNCNSFVWWDLISNFIRYDFFQEQILFTSVQIMILFIRYSLPSNFRIDDTLY